MFFVRRSYWSARTTILKPVQAELDQLMANPVVAGATNKDAFWIGIVEKNKVSIGVDGSDVVTNYGPNEPNDKTGKVC